MLRQVLFFSPTLFYLFFFHVCTWPLHIQITANVTSDIVRCNDARIKHVLTASTKYLHHLISEAFFSPLLVLSPSPSSRGKPKQSVGDPSPPPLSLGFSLAVLFM